mmetsp:Transcript_5703/g.9049  ORF Transcript_5703/g.9049 Transcript_5703/m.9049 type:complete len:166 (+) Transcript_5703:1827-2324(+)
MNSVHSFHEIKTQLNHVVYTQSHPSTHIYIVKEGEFEVYRQRKNRLFFTSEDREEQRDKQAAKIFAFHKANPAGGSEQRWANPLTIPAKQRIHLVPLRRYGAGQLFGEDDVVYDRNYTTTVKCISVKGALYSIKSSEFKFKFKRDDKAWNAILKMADLKNDETKH